jgi:uncharacterized alpha-E superfamily protein
MLSRVAENIYWLARYVERAENTARLVASTAPPVLDMPRGITPAGRRWSRSPACTRPSKPSTTPSDERNVSAS